MDRDNPRLVLNSFLPLAEGLPYDTWDRDNRTSLRDEVVRFLLWVLSRRPAGGPISNELCELLDGPPVESVAVHRELDALSNDSRLKLRSIVVTALLYAKDPRGLERLRLAVANKETELLDQGEIAHAVRRKLDSTRTEHAEVLAELLKCDSKPFRRAVALQLARIHAKGSVPVLATLLDDPDPEIVASAVGGLAMFANGVPPGGLQPGSGPAPFRTDETIAHSVMSADAVVAKPSYYVDFWKSWWAQNAADILRNKQN